ncbi:MAG: exonuclease [SAR202 cluster bacterium]|nr:exonuclease [SAR202 cluster bacterium]
MSLNCLSQEGPCGSLKVLRHSFIHFPGVGSTTEKHLWEAGIRTWDDFRAATTVPLRASGMRDVICARIDESRERLETRDGAFFSACFTSHDRWRIYSDFRDQAAFLDIETTGLSPQSSRITMVGVLDREGYRAFVAGENLDELPRAMERYSLIVTYNGASFDIPFVEYFFGKIFRHAAHLDLRYPLKRLGYGGGLKQIERELRVARPSELSELGGFEAVIMWQMWERGERGALDTLVRYNAEDVASLPALADIAYNELLDDIPFPVEPVRLWNRPVIDLPYDPSVVRRLAGAKVWDRPFTEQRGVRTY